MISFQIGLNYPDIAQPNNINAVLDTRLNYDNFSKLPHSTEMLIVAEYFRSRNVLQDPIPGITTTDTLANKKLLFIETFPSLSRKQ